MKVSWIAIAAVTLAAGFSLATADPAHARVKHNVALHCAQTATDPTVYGFSSTPAPQPERLVRRRFYASRLLCFATS